MAENQARVSHRKAERRNRSTPALSARSPGWSAARDWTTRAGGTSPSGSGRSATFDRPRRAVKLPRVLTAEEFRQFYKVVDQAEDVQHGLMLRLLFYTAVRVAELCGIEVADIDLENCKIRINKGKGSKDRYVLFGKSFATALRTHIAAHPNNRWLFQTRRNSRFTTRRVQQIVKQLPKRPACGPRPHTFRHQAITWLTRHSGLADAELQLITGHAGGKRWRSTSTSPWMATLRRSTSDDEGRGPVRAGPERRNTS